MRSFYKLAALSAAAFFMAAPSSAQREMELDSEIAWTHPHSGIVVPTTLGGLPRGQVTEFAEDHLNLGFSFRRENLPEELTVYIYRDTNGGVPVWFEQARLGVEGRDIYNGPQIAFGIEQYAWPGHASWQGQRAVYATPDSEYSTSTGVALFSVNGWFVKMRATSGRLTAEQLGALMDQAFTELAPPEAKFDQPAVIPIEDCAEKLAFKKKAKDAKQDGAAGLLGALLGGIVAKEVKEQRQSDEPPEAIAWCRDGGLSRMQTAYRANASTNSYLIALGDSGMGVSVGPDIAGALLGDEAKSDKPTFGITVITDSQRINYVPQDRLPSYKRVLEIINANRRTGAVSTWGDDTRVEVNTDTL